LVRMPKLALIFDESIHNSTVGSLEFVKTDETVS
jgi:hypothetical protein